MFYFEENFHWKCIQESLVVKNLFSDYVKIVKIYMVNFNVVIFNMLKIMDFYK